MKWIKHILLSGLIALFAGITGCQQADSLKCQYQSGSSERIKVSQEKHYESWVEMPEKEPSQRNSRSNRQELTLLRQIESVESDGSALMVITIEKAEVTLNINTQNSKSTHSYVSTVEKTDTTWGNEPKIAGTTYKIKISPDTTVLEVIGLDQARSQLKLKEDSRGVVANLLTEKAIRKIHERNFVKDYPGPEALMPVPDAMIKAKAIRKSYTYQNDAEANRITAQSTGEPLYTLPEGFAKPPTPTNPGQTMIISIGEMDELTVQGQGEFDLAKGTVVSEQNNIKCILLITESNLSGQGDQAGKKGSGGIMFTVTEIKENFEQLN